MIRIDTEALRAKRDAIEQEIVRHREAIVALEQRRSDLDIGERIIAEFATEESRRETPREETQERMESASQQDKSGQKRPEKPAGLPIMSAMIIAAFRDAHQRGAAGMKPTEVTTFIRKNYWPEAPPEAVTPIVWRMWKKDGVLEKHGSLYVLPVKRQTHNDVEDGSSDHASDDLLSKARTSAFRQATLQ
jgi:hypothetical protein